MTPPEAVPPPSEEITALANEHLASRATPYGALGRLGELGVWLAAAQGEVPPRPLADVRCVLFAGDHGVADHGVSAAPKVVTAAMMPVFVSGRSGMCALAAAHGVGVRVLDIGVDADLVDFGVEPATAATVAALKVRRGCGAIHLEDAMTRAETEQALAGGAQVAREEGAADVLISGDMGIGNTTPAAALVAAALGLQAHDVTGLGSGIEPATWEHKVQLIQTALDRARSDHGDRLAEPVTLLTALGSPDLAATAGFLAQAAKDGVPVLLDGLMSVACALVAERLAPGAAAWFLAGHRSPEPAQSLALAELGLTPLLDLGMRLGEGSGAVAAVPLLRSAVAVMRDVAPLAEVMPG